MLIKKVCKSLLPGFISISMIISTTMPLPVLADYDTAPNESPSLYSAPLTTEIYKDTSGTYSFAERAADLVSRMTVAEKASQATGSMSPAIPRLGVSKYQWWNEALHGFAATSPESASGMGTMPSYGTSVPNSTSYPQSTSMASSWDPKLYYQEASQISDEIRERVVDNNKNLNMYSPNINLQRDPRWGRNEEAYSEDPYLTGVMGSAFVSGMEGKDYLTGNIIDPKGYKKVSTTIKHYTANNSENNRTGPLNGGLANAANGGVEGGAYNVDYRAMREYFTAPYRNIIKATDVGSVMTAYSTVNALPVSMSSYFMDTLLRQTFGFSGFITSDCDSVQTIINNHVTNPRTGKEFTIAEQFATAFAHGEDLECNSGMTVAGTGNYWVNYDKMLSGVITDKGLFTENQFDISVHRLFTTRMQFGEFDGVTTLQSEAQKRMAEGTNGKYVKGLFGQTQERLDLAETLSENSIVMLKNGTPRNGAGKMLPLSLTATAATPLKVAIIGQWARTGTYLGQYSSTQNVTGETDSNYVTIERGIIAALKAKYGDNVQIEYYRGFTNTQTALASLTTINQADVTAAGSADLAIVVAATEQATSREGTDRTTINLPGAQAQLVSAVGKANPNTIVILETCGPVQVTSFEPDVAAILWSSFGGIKKGVGYGKIITGVVNPSGKTQQLWYKNVDNADPNSDITSIYDYDLYESPGHPGRTYMYYSKTYEPNGVSYPFGFGLSYTNYTYSNAVISENSFTADGTVTISFDVQNTGSVAGKEVTQLYAAQPGTTLPNRPIKRLVGFEKVELQPSEKKTVTLQVNVKDLAYFDANEAKYVVDTGAWQLQIGAACNDIKLTRDFTVTNGQITEKPAVVTFKPNQTGDETKGIAERLIYNKNVVIDPHTAVSMNNEAMYGYFIDNNIPGYSDLGKAGIIKLRDIPGTVTYVSNRPSVVAIENGKIVTKAPGVATITATATYNESSAKGEFVVVVLSDPGPASINIDGKAIDGYDPSVLNYSVEVPDSVTKVPTVTVTPNSDADSVYSIVPAARIPGITEIRCMDKSNGTEVVYKIGFAYKFKSVDFTKAGSWPISGWSAPDNAGRAVLSADGLRLTAQRGAFGTAPAPENVIKQAAPGDWLVRSHISLSPTLSANNQQTGLIVYDDTQNYIRYVYERPSTGTTNVLRIYQAVNGFETQAYTVNLAGAVNLYLQIQKQDAAFSFAYSTNDVTWTRITTTLPVLARYALPQIGVWTNTGDTGAASFNATYEYVNAFTLTEASPTLATLTLNGAPVTGFIPNSNAVTDFTYSASDFTSIPTVTATASAGLSVDVKQAGTLPGMATVTVSSQVASTNYYVVFDETPVSDTFIAGNKDGKWKIINPSSPANWSLDAGLGLRLPTQRYDMTTTNANWQDLFARPGGGNWEILSKVYYPVAPNAATQNIGLYAYQDDNNFMKIDARYNAAGPRIYVTTERNGAASTAYAALPSNAVASDGSLTLYYMISKFGDIYTFRYAVDPSDFGNFIVVGNTVEFHLVNPQIALLAAKNSANSATSPEIQTYCEYVVYKPLDGFTTWSDGYLETSLAGAFNNAVAVFESNLPGVAEGDLKFTIPHDYMVSVISSDPAVIDASGRVTPSAQDKNVDLIFVVYDKFGHQSPSIEKTVLVKSVTGSMSVVRNGDGSYRASANLANASANAVDVVLILAAYADNGSLIASKTETVTAPASGNISVTADQTFTGAATVKAFLWDAATFVPIIQSVTYK